MLFFCNVEYFFLNFCKITLFSSVLSQSRRLPLLQVVSKNKSFSVGVQSPTEINAPRGCAVILKRICQLSLTRITHQVSRAFDLNLWLYFFCSALFFLRFLIGNNNTAACISGNIDSSTPHIKNTIHTSYQCNAVYRKSYGSQHHCQHDHPGTRNACGTNGCQCCRQNNGHHLR